MTTGAFERIVRQTEARRAAAAERCDLCGEPVPEEHRHLLDTRRGEAMCACPACALLFDRDAASRGHYRLIPQRRRRLRPVPTAALGVPVGLAFFTVGADGAVLAHYPSPAGPTRWEVDAAAWREIAADRPELTDLAPDVEALLVNTVRGRPRHWIVPIDDCFRLVAVVREHWTGLSGGSRVWPEIERFFDDLTEHR